jgi:hypothetical protein
LLMHGFSPVDGEPIRPAGSDKTRVAGVDLTFSPRRPCPRCGRRRARTVARRSNSQANDTSLDHDHGPAERDPYIEQAIQDAKDHQQSQENSIDPDHDNDRGFGIE